MAQVSLALKIPLRPKAILRYVAFNEVNCVANRSADYALNLVTGKRLRAIVGAIVCVVHDFFADDVTDFVFVDLVIVFHRDPYRPVFASVVTRGDVSIPSAIFVD